MPVVAAYGPGMSVPRRTVAGLATAAAEIGPRFSLAPLLELADRAGLTTPPER
jgi:hypothetical protein